MYARMVTFQGSAEQVETEGVQRLHEQSLATLRQQPGFQSVLVLLNRQQGKLVGITLWDTEEHADAASAAMSQLRSASAAQMTSAPPISEGFDVVAQA